MKNSGIQWTHHTHNPWWGCAHKSPGCINCYAEAQADGWLKKGIWGPNAPRRFFEQKHHDKPYGWNNAAFLAGRRERVFCASMSDVFEDRTDLDYERLRLFNTIRQTPQLDWLLLTKRPELVRQLLQTAQNMAFSCMQSNHPQFGSGIFSWLQGWLNHSSIPQNVWIGSTVEDQRRADERLQILNELPAKHHFVSYEPALEQVDFHFEDFGNIDWLICGGESGRKARPFRAEWAHHAMFQAHKNNVPFFMKQMGENAAAEAGGQLVQIKTKSKKGGDLEDLPMSLQCRQFPHGVAA